MTTFNELMADYDKERLAEIARDEARRATPEAMAAHAKRKADEFALGVREGWWDKDGNPIDPPAEDGIYPNDGEDDQDLDDARDSDPEEAY